MHRLPFTLPPATSWEGWEEGLRVGRRMWGSTRRQGVGLLFIPHPHLCALCFLSLLLKGSTLTPSLPSAMAVYGATQNSLEGNTDLNLGRFKSEQPGWGWGRGLSTGPVTGLAFISRLGGCSWPRYPQKERDFGERSVVGVGITQVNEPYHIAGHA